MTKIYLEKTSSTQVTREATEDRWDRDDTSTDWNFGGVFLQKRENFWLESFETTFDIDVGDIIYLVIAVWSTGDSFGHDMGANSEIFGVFKTYEEAEKLKTNLKTGNGYDKYQLPWDGYFESLDYITIHSRTVS